MRFIFALLLLTTPAMAQQQVASPSQIAVQIDNAIGILAQRAEYAEGQVKQLQAELADLKSKCGEPCKDGPK